MGLVLVPTPLGNLQDITLRALEVLRSCALIAAEDTRVARRLLSAYGITGKTLVSYREQNAAEATAALLARAQTEVVALLSDAGMPGVSDPGCALVSAARAAGVAVTVLPGPVAYICAAVLSGFNLSGLIFGGFLPRSARARRDALRAALQREGPTAWYESPHRTIESLEALEAIDADASVFLARELTKLYEQQVLGTPREAIAALETPVRGEIVIVVAPRARDPNAEKASFDVDAEIDALLAAGTPPAAIAKKIASRMRMSRPEAYTRVVARRTRRRSAGEPGDVLG
ncbi:MAG: 16S rRNA (cytidine(1402)-2'-O)-methyltransferase [Candidatus Eremiobacteraeota bacterium]|nr:16S rRNA (cytidine(1402)-2'-O)-methyltransferase [Candidatus Eremiobacteraeota bacterium]